MLSEKGYCCAVRFSGPFWRSWFNRISFYGENMDCYKFERAEYQEFEFNRL